MLSFRPGDRFSYDGVTYTIKNVTPNALEIASHAQQSLWVSVNDFMDILGLKGRAALFRWLHEVSHPPRF